MKSLGKVDEVRREREGSKKVELEEAKEDLTKGKEGEVGGFVLAWVKSWRGVKKVVEKAMEDIFGGCKLKRFLKFRPFFDWNMEDNLCLIQNGNVCRLEIYMGEKY